MSKAIVMPLSSVFSEPTSDNSEPVGVTAWNAKTAPVLTKPATAPRPTLIQ